MSVVVAGGTGFLGRHIVEALLHGGHPVIVLGRDPAKAERLPQLAGTRARRGDVTDPRTLRGALDGATALVCAVQFPNHPMEVPRRGLTYDRYDRRGTENLLAEAARAGVERVVYVSGAGADPGDRRSWYRAKGRAEEAVRSSGLEFAILRPSWAYGPGDRALSRFATIARRSPVVPRIGTSPQLIQPVHASDVGLAVARVFERDAWGRTLEIGSVDILTMDEVIRTLLRVLGLRRAVLPVPAGLVKAAAAPLVVLPRPPLTPAGVEFAVQDGLVDVSETIAALGFVPVPLAEGLARYLSR